MCTGKSGAFIVSTSTDVNSNLKTIEAMPKLSQKAAGLACPAPKMVCAKA